MPTGIKGFQIGHKTNVGKHWKIKDTSNVGKYWKNKQFTKEHKRKLGLVWKGRKHSLKSKQQISKSHFGLKLSKDVKQKISKAHLGKKSSFETRKKMSLSHKGSKSYLWKGGISPLHKQIRLCFESRQWRSDVFTRDNFTCQMCGKRGYKLNAHHLKPFNKIVEEYKIKSIQEALNCDELWNINNGQTLCHNCHKKTNTYARSN